jgi:hypothetical protein
MGPPCELKLASSLLHNCEKLCIANFWGMTQYSLIETLFYVLLTEHLDLLCVEHQYDALFIINLFRHSTSTCFGRMLPIIRRYTV